jgi:quinol monooxygenase YgiN
MIVRAETREGCDEQVAALLRQVAERVREREPECWSYVVTRLIGSREHFAVHARFSSFAAFNAHAETPHLTDALPRLAAMLATPISMEIFVEIPSRRAHLGVGHARREIEAQS